MERAEGSNEDRPLLPKLPLHPHRCLPHKRLRVADCDVPTRYAPPILRVVTGPIGAWTPSDSARLEASPPGDADGEWTPLAEALPQF